MNGYTKITVLSSRPTSNSRSVDLSDITFSPPRPHEHPDPTTMVQQGQADNKARGQLPSVEGDGGEMFGVILRRNYSSASQRFRASERSHGSNATFQSVVRRAFSMKKDDSVADGYWRMLDTGDGDGNGEMEQEQQQQQQTASSKRKRWKILRACKRLLGL